MFGEDDLIQQLQPAGACKPWGQMGSRFNLAPVTCDIDGDRWNFDLESTTSVSRSASRYMVHYGASIPIIVIIYGYMMGLYIDRTYLVGG